MDDEEEDRKEAVLLNHIRKLLERQDQGIKTT